MLGFVNPENPEKGVLYILVANLLASLVKPILLFDSFRLKASYDRVLMKKMVVGATSHTNPHNYLTQP